MKTEYNIKIITSRCSYPSSEMYIYNCLLDRYFRISLRRAPRKKLTRKSIKILLGSARKTYLDFEEFSKLKFLKTDTIIDYAI